MAGAPTLPSTSAVIDFSEMVTRSGVLAGIAVGAALLLHLVVFALLGRMARASQSETDDLVFNRISQPLRWAMAAVALSLASEGDALLARGWGMAGRFVEPLLFGWVAFALVKAFAAALDLRTQTYEDELAARSRRTRIAIFSRTAGFLIVFVSVALVLFGIPAVRNIGVTLMASAGVATLAVGAAAQPALKSLIAGMQIALTEPIRIGDFVVVDGESGRVEDIRLSYVVIRTADERRLIVPTAKFLDASFQNWTRQGGGITGSVVLPIKPGHAIEPIREGLSGAACRPSRLGSAHRGAAGVGGPRRLGRTQAGDERCRSRPRSAACARDARGDARMAARAHAQRAVRSGVTG
jgi:small-conductance mechanosensitive channel